MANYEHGDYLKYKAHKCRCTACRAANAANTDRRRRLIAYGRWTGLVDATGTIRRLRALAVIGWSSKLIADRIGIDPSVIREIARGERVKVQPITARHIAEVYDDWSTEDGPTRQAASHARKKGWHGPEAWTDNTIDDPTATPGAGVIDVDIDELAVQWATEGDRHIARQLNPVECLHVVDALTRRRHSAAEIADLLGTSDRAVQRHRHVLREIEGGASVIAVKNGGPSGNSDPVPTEKPLASAA